MNEQQPYYKVVALSMDHSRQATDAAPQHLVMRRRDAVQGLVFQLPHKQLETWNEKHILSLQEMHSWAWYIIESKAFCIWALLKLGQSHKC